MYIRLCVLMYQIDTCWAFITASREYSKLVKIKLKYRALKKFDTGDKISPWNIFVNYMPRNNSKETRLCISIATFQIPVTLLIFYNFFWTAPETKYKKPVSNGTWTKRKPVFSGKNFYIPKDLNFKIIIKVTSPKRDKNLSTLWFRYRQVSLYQILPALQNYPISGPLL
jgi:hypothetical protein